MQLGSELDPGRSTADDDDAQPGRRIPRPVVRLDAGVDETPVEAVGLGRGLERVGVLHDPGNAEGVRDAADRNHQGVVAQRAPRDDFVAAFVDDRRHGDLAALAIEAFQGAAAEIEMMPARLGEVVELVRVDIHASGGDLVQQGLPQMCLVSIDQRHRGAPAPRERIARAGRELETSRASADDDDMVWTGHGFVTAERRLL